MGKPDSGPPAPRYVEMLVRVRGVTTRPDEDLDAFVAVVIRGGRRHLGIEAGVRIETVSRPPSAAKE